MPTAFAYTGGDYPTFREYVSHVWCFLIHGAKAIAPYAYHDLGDRPSVFRGVKFTNETIERLEKILLLGKRTMIVKDDYEAALWEYEGKRLFAIVNLKNEKLKVEVPFKGKWTAFRGSGARDGTTALPLEAYESAVFTSEKMDEGLRSYEEAQAEVDKLEAERLGRDNQLLGRHLDIEFKKMGQEGWRFDGMKLFDGTRDMLGFNASAKDSTLWFGLSKAPVKIDRIVIYGWHTGGAKFEFDGKTIAATEVESDEFHQVYRMDGIYSPKDLKITFPQAKVQVYEIELPNIK